MNFSSLNSSWRLASLSNKVLLVANLLLAFAVVVLGGAAINNRERITVVPPNIDKPYTIGWRSATPEYYKSFALYFSGLIGQISPKNIEFVIQTVVDRFCDAPIADGIKKKLRAIAADYQFQQSTASSWFEGDKLFWEESSGKVFVTGRLWTVYANRNVVSRDVTYEYRIEVREGQPVITNFDSYEGTTPHTEAWHRDPKKTEADMQRRSREVQTTRENTETIETRQKNDASAKGVGQ